MTTAQFPSRLPDSACASDADALPGQGGDILAGTAAFNRQLSFAKSRIGAGPYLLVVLMLGGGVYSAEGSLLLLLSIIGRGLVQKWELNPVVAGVMATALFSGLLTGTIVGGIACDSLGRRTPILITYLGISVFIVIGILMPYVLLMLLAKLLLGFFLGFGVPAANAIVCESCPAHLRSIVYSLTQVLFSMGQIYSATIVWIISPMMTSHDMQWRGMLAVATILPMVLLLFSYFFLLESPHWLLANERVSAAREVVQQIAEYKSEDTMEDLTTVTAGMKTPYQSRENFSYDPEVLLDETTSLLSPSNHHLSPVEFIKMACTRMISNLWRVQSLFSEEYRQTTILMSFVAFAANYAYYGMIYGTPDMMKQTIGDSQSAWSPAAGVFFAALFELPGVLIAIVLGLALGRRMNMAIAFSGTAAFLTMVIYSLARTDPGVHVGIVGVCGVKLCIASGFIVVNLYLLECYPTKFRATGLAFCMVLGRMGAFACPFLHDGLLLLGLSNLWFFVCMACLLLGASIACLSLPYETKDEELKDDQPPASPAPHRPVGSSILMSFAKHTDHAEQK